MRMHVLSLGGMPAALGLALCVSGAGGLGCSSSSSVTDLKTSGPPDIKQVFVRVNDPVNGPTPMLTFGSHPDWSEAKLPEPPVADAMPYAYAGAQKIRVVVDELLQGNTMETFACACAYSSTATGATAPGDCGSGPWTAKFEDAAQCPENAATDALEAGKLFDGNGDGMPDQAIVIPGLVTVNCGSFEPWTNGATCTAGSSGCPFGTLNDGFYNPTGNQIVPNYGAPFWEGLGPAVIVEPALLPTNTACTVSVASSITNKDGQSINAPGSAPGFTTAALAIDASDPADAATDVAADSAVAITMNSLLDPATVTAATVTMKKSDGTAVTGTVEVDADGQTIIFTPDAALDAASDYTVTVGTGVKDTFAVPTPSARTVSFTTAS